MILKWQYHSALPYLIIAQVYPSNLHPFVKILPIKVIGCTQWKLFKTMTGMQSEHKQTIYIYIIMSLLRISYQ